MNEALTFRALALLPAAEQGEIRAVAHFGDLDDLVQNAWLAALEAKRSGLSNVKRGDSVRSLADRARSCSRRYTQDPVYYGRSLDGLADMPVEPQAAGGMTRREIAREITADFRVGPRRARQIIERQIDRARMGDLFADLDGDDDEKGDE